MCETNKSNVQKKAYDIGRKFLKDLDDLIKDEWKNITCRDIAEIYNDFAISKNSVMREYVGSGGNFTGLSEFLIARLVIAQLTQEYKCNFTLERHNDWKYFIDETKNITLYHDCKYQGVEPEIRKLKPDIAIYKNNKVKFIIAIKISESNAKIRAEIDKLIKFRRSIKDVKCLLLVFYPKGKTFETINKKITDKDKLWLKSIILYNEQKDTFLCNKIKEALNFKSIIND